MGITTRTNPIAQDRAKRLTDLVKKFYMKMACHSQIDGQIEVVNKTLGMLL